MHGIANFAKNGTTRKVLSCNRYSVTHNYFRSSLRILFTAFLETKTELWKLMKVISGCCIGSSGSPLHPPLYVSLKITCKKVNLLKSLKVLMYQKYSDISRVYYTLIETKIEN